MYSLLWCFLGAEVTEDEEDVGLSMKTISRRSRELPGVCSHSVVVRKLPSHTKIVSYVVGLYMQTIAGIETSNIKISGPLAVVEFPEPVGEFILTAACTSCPQITPSANEKMGLAMQI